jgi:ATP-dependent DNA helicase 2 subunit 2
LGVFGTIAEAIDELDIPVVKPTRPFKSYEGALTLGDPSLTPAAVVIDVERYFRTKAATQPSASTVVVKSEPGGGSQATSQTLDDAMEGVEFGSVKQARTYKVNDPSAPGGKKDVEFESLAKGYEYGRTAVYISEADKDITTLETKKQLTILGFIDQRKACIHLCSSPPRSSTDQ